jgi:hypothetical protein
MKNQEILDEDLLDNSKKVIDKRTEKPIQRTAIYSAIMIIVGYGLMCFEYRDTLLKADFSFYMTLSFSIIFFCFVISFVLESFWFLFRKFGRKKDDIITLVDPFWFQIIESAFSIWILFTALFVIRQLVF